MPFAIAALLIAQSVSKRIGEIISVLNPISTSDSAPNEGGGGGYYGFALIDRLAGVRFRSGEAGALLSPTRPVPPALSDFCCVSIFRAQFCFGRHQLL